MEEYFKDLPKDIVMQIFKYAGPPSNPIIVDILKTNEFKRQRKKLLMHWRNWWPSLREMNQSMIGNAKRRNVPKHQELRYLKQYCIPSWKYLPYVITLEGDEPDLNMEPMIEIWKRPRGRLPNIPHVHFYDGSGA